MDGVGEEVCSVRDEEDETALDFRIPPNMCEFQKQTRRKPDQQSDDKRAKEDQQENANRLEQTQHRQLPRRRARSVLLRRFEQYDSDGVVQDRLAEDDGVQLGVDFIGVEDGEDGDGIGSGECSADGDGFDEGDVEAFEWDARPEVEDDA